MTRRERLENKVAKRLEWAAGRRSKAAGLDARNKPYEGDIAFNTQPGHIPERARVIARTDKAFEHREMANHHDAKAAGLAHHLDRSIFSDDPDAIEALREKITGLEAERERAKAINKEIKKGEGWVARLADKGLTLTDEERATLINIAKYTPYHCDKKTGLPVFPGYHITSLGARIRKAEERIKEIEAANAKAAAVEATPDGILVENLGAGYEGGTNYTRVTFAEKPDRKILDALRAAGYYWSHGSWVGLTSKLPEVR